MNRRVYELFRSQAQLGDKGKVHLSVNKNPLPYVGVFGCGVLASWLWNLLSGRFDFHYTIIFLLVAIALLGTMIYTFGTVLFACLGSVSEGRFRAAIFSGLLLGAFGSLPFLIHSNFYLLGVRQRICSQMTPDQIRLLAARGMESPHSENGSLLTFTPAWRKAQEVPGFSNLDHDLGFFVGPYGMVVWFGGCSVCGHTGLQVQEPAVTNRYSKGGHLSIAPDIEVFYAP